MAQQYYPASYGAPRYANKALGIPYVSAYDPTLSQRYGALMQQEYGKAMGANQAVASREAEIGDIYSEDQEGKQQVLGAYKEKIGKIKEAYGNDLALAAPELARSIVQERSNPWYNKNMLYNKESERRQKLLDQYGPNIQFVKDLPQGNLNDMEQEDIGFDYYNRAHIHDLLKRQYGNMADITTPLGMKQLEDFPAFARDETMLGLSQTQAASLGEEGAYQHVQDQLEGMGINASPEMVEMLKGEIDTWAAGNLVGGTKSQIRQIASLAQKDGSGIPPDLFSKTNLVKVDEEGQEAVSPREAAKTGRDVMDRYSTGALSYEEQQAIQDDPELQGLIDNSPILTAFSESVPSFGNIPEELQPQVITSLREEASGLTPARDAVIDVLNQAGVIEVRTQLTPQGTTGIMSIDGKDVNKRQLNKFIDPLVEEFKELREYNNSGKGKQLAKAVNAKVNPTTERGIYGMANESQGNVKQYFNDVVLATDAENLASAGVYIEKRSGKDLSQKKSSNKIEDLQSLSQDTEIGRVSYKESGSKGAAPELMVDTSEGTLHIPLKGEQGEIHGMELSVRTLDPKIINDVFRAVNDEAFTESGGSIPVGAIFGDKDLKIPNMDNVYRKRVNNQLIYVAPVGGAELQAATPTELYQKIAVYINRALPEGYRMQVQNPTLQFLIRRYSDLLTPSKEGQAVLGQIGSILSNQ